MEINATLVKELRDATNVSMMECKRALVEANGDIGQATKLLRERGMAVAAKKATRVANQGIIASAYADGGKTASLVEVNCETDFVARNDGFKTFVAQVAEKATTTDASLAETLKTELTAKIAEIGENLIIRNNLRYILKDKGSVVSYIHLGGKVGVLIEVGCTKDETTKNAQYIELIKDLAMHVAACSPKYLESSEVPAEELKAEREIYAKQVEGKPAQIVDKIVDGKIRKYFEEVCFINQPFVKEQKQSVKATMDAVAKSVNDTLTLRRFVRWQIGK